MKKIAIVMLCILVVAAVATSSAATKWQFARVFTSKANTTQGCAVAPDGKVWVCTFNASGDTLLPYTSMRSIVVYNTDGTVAKRIQTLTVGATTDTLNNTINGRGIYRAKNGDILYSVGGKPGGYRINSSTYQGIAKFTTTYSVARMCDTDNGDVIVGPVGGGAAGIKLYTTGLAFVSNLVSSTPQTARGFLISGDGKYIYHGAADGPGVLKYYSAFGVLDTFVVADTLLKGKTGGSLGWRKGNLWVGSDADFAWYEVNPTTKAILDSIKWDTTGTNPKLCATRGIDFSLGGDTAYVAGSDGGAVEMFVQTIVSVEPVKDAVPHGYALSQNYPNPFNPTTEIQFTVMGSGQTTIKVYDVLGKEVATLVDEHMSPGTYRTKFDAAGLSSGTYIYTLTQNGTRLTNKMMLVK